MFSVKNQFPKLNKNYCIFFLLLLFSCGTGTTIDREALVKRHIPTAARIDSLSPFTVGNGEFAFTPDITGLQTFPDYYKNGIPLGTQSNWGWHSIPNTKNLLLDQTFEKYNAGEKIIEYASNQNSEAGRWLRANPHRLHLGMIGFKIKKPDGSEIKINDVKNISQSENIWEGMINSSFSIENNIVNVETACHPELDQIAVKIKSGYLKSGNISVGFDFPYGSLEWGNDAANWNNPDSHSSKIISRESNSIVIERTLDTTKYFVKVEWDGKAEFEEIKKHSFALNVSGGEDFSFTCFFSKKKILKEHSTAEQTFQTSQKHWKNFWLTGGAIDLSESTDPRAIELERRIILSRYLTAIQCAGSIPTQETGLTFNSWFGKYHLEMHWWHSVQFILWEKPELFEKSLEWYKNILPVAENTARQQGYKGARWPKMIGPDGNESPSSIGVFLIWQQPHPIYYAELLYKYSNDKSVLEKYKELVFRTAEFMSSFARWDEKNKRYILGQPLIPAQEIYKPDSTLNPAFELSYWKFGLETAQKWRERLELKRNEKWDDIIKNLAKLPEKNGLYQNAENALNTFEEARQRNDHPTLLGSFGMLPNENVDIKKMENTLEQVLISWNWESTWGWDYPLIAMTAARVGRPDLAIDALLMNVQKNTYLPNGHNYQDKRLTIYLPGNGGVLAAVAMMAAGWNGAPKIHAPGFPKDGSWVVKYEGINPIP